MNQKNNIQQGENKGNEEPFDIDSAMNELQSMIHEASEMYFQMKKVKFDYLVQTCELYSRIDYPSIMMEVSRKEVFDNIPKAKAVSKMDY